MIHCASLEIDKLEGTLRELIRKRVNPQNADKYIEKFSPSKTYKRLCFTVIQGETLYAFALVTYTYSSHLAEVDQIFVEPSENPYEIVPTLLDLIEKTVALMRCLVIQYLYEMDKDAPIPSIEKILLAQGWGLKTLRFLLYYFDVYAFNPPWFQKKYPLPSGFSISLWKDLEERERKRLEEEEQMFTYPPFIAPLSENAAIQNLNSLVLKFQEKVIGWMITHTFPSEKDTVRYSAFFVHPEYRNRGVAVPLLQLSIRLQQNSSLQWAFLLINMEYTEDRWLRFLEKRLEKSTYRVVQIFRLSKALSSFSR